MLDKIGLRKIRYDVLEQLELQVLIDKINKTLEEKDINL